MPKRTGRRKKIFLDSDDDIEAIKQSPHKKRRQFLEDSDENSEKENDDSYIKKNNKMRPLSLNGKPTSLQKKYQPSTKQMNTKIFETKKKSKSPGNHKAKGLKKSGKPGTRDIRSYFMTAETFFASHDKINSDNLTQQVSKMNIAKNDEKEDTKNTSNSNNNNNNNNNNSNTNRLATLDTLSSDSDSEENDIELMKPAKINVNNNHKDLLSQPLKRSPKKKLSRSNTDSSVTSPSKTKKPLKPKSKPKSIASPKNKAMMDLDDLNSFKNSFSRNKSKPKRSLKDITSQSPKPKPKGTLPFCVKSPAGNNSNNNNKNKNSVPRVSGKKRKLDEMNGPRVEKEVTKKQRYYPGFKRNDNPPLRGTKELPVGKEYCLSGKKFVITGQLPSITREECEDLIKSYGGQITKAVSGMTRYLIVGAEPGQSKLKKAKAKGTKCITEDDLFELIKTLPQGKPPKIKVRKPSLSKAKTANLLPKRKKRSNYNNNNNNNKIEKMDIDNPNNKFDLFVEKYKPQTSNDLVGNNGILVKLRNYLKTFNDIKHDSKAKKAALLSGKPGVGKTSCAKILSKECGYDVLEFNASDVRSKKSLKKQIEDALDTNTIKNFFGGVKTKKTTTNKVLIMDEVDGMSSGDRGGIQELVSYIKLSKTPIICICNDRNSQKLKTLSKYCIDLRFRKLTDKQIAGRLKYVAQNENIDIDNNALLQLAAGTNGDIRQCLNLLQFWSTNKTIKQNLNYNNVKTLMKNSNKDFTMGCWDVLPKLFSPYCDSVSKGLEHFFVDYSLMPLFVHESYLKIKENNVSSYQNLNSIYQGTLAMADSDIISQRIQKNQDYSLLPIYGVLSTYAPVKNTLSVGHFQRSGYGSGFNFPTWMGRNSKRRKNVRLFTELYSHIHENISGDTKSLILDYLDLLKKKIIKPLENNDIDNPIKIMKEYNLTRDDWDSIFELGVGVSKDDYKIQTKIKTKFTRKCKTELQTFQKLKNKAAFNTKDKLVLNDDNKEQEEDDDDEDNEENNNKKSTKKKTNKKTTKKTKKTNTKKKNTKKKTQTKRGRKKKL